MEKRILAGVVSFAALAGLGVAAEDKYAVKVPGGLAFSEFRGYEAWQTISVSRHEKVLAVILGNSAMINAYQAGIPGNGKPFRTEPGWPKFIGRRSRTSFSRTRQCRASL